MLAKIKLNFVTFLPLGLGPLQKGRNVSLEQFLLRTFYLFDSIFLGIDLD